jgi:hypothetical protein
MVVESVYFDIKMYQIVVSWRAREVAICRVLLIDNISVKVVYQERQFQMNHTLDVFVIQISNVVEYN